MITIRLKRWLAALLVSSSLLPSVTALADNPAFDDNTEREVNRTQQLIFIDVHEKLSNLLPLTHEAFQGTLLFDHLGKDYREINYKSEVEADGLVDGMLGDQIILDAVKKPMTEPAQIELAELLRYYYYNFTDAEIYQPLSQQAALDYDQREAMKDAQGKDRNLNYFDYITLIETIFQTPTYTPAIRSEKLVEVEEELQASIQRLYGVGKTHINLSSWGPNKSVDIPFSDKRYSYLQLLAAYQREPSVVQTLEFYSALIDSLYAIRNYSQSLRQGLAQVDEGLDMTPYIQRIEATYEPLEEGIIQDAKNVLVRDNLASKAIMDGEQWEQSQLGNLGVTGEVRN